MKKRIEALWVLAVFCALPGPSALAQMDFGEDEADMEFDMDAAEEAEESTDIFSSLATEDDTRVESAEERPKETVEEIFAIQRIYALRLRRLELAPSAAFNINDPYQSYVGAGLAVNYWFTNVLAIGANAIWYQFSDSLGEQDLPFFIRRSTRLANPLSQWQVGANVNFTYVPLYGKFAAFNKLIFQWDAYIVGGVGLMRTRPVPVFDQQRDFPDFNTHLGFNVGIGLRIFMTRFLTIFFEARDYIFLEQFENTQVALGEARNDPDTWLADSTLYNNLTMSIGLTVFFPFKFEYRKPK
jgi:outer membrane beta-barrel protein